MSQKVRRFEKTDIDTVSGFMAEVPDGWTRNGLESSFSNRGIKGFVLEEDGVIVSFAIYLTAEDAELVFLVTDSTKRGKGYGRRLLCETLDIIRMPCVLEVRESNIPAINLYESVGFKLIGRRKGFYTNPPEAALVYNLGGEEYNEIENIEYIWRKNL